MFILKLFLKILKLFLKTLKLFLKTLKLFLKTLKLLEIIYFIYFYKFNKIYKYQIISKSFCSSFSSSEKLLFTI